MMDKGNAPEFEDIKVHVRFKLFASGCSVRFFYIYGFRALSAWKIAGNCRWKSALRCYLSRSLAGVSAVMIIPSLMLPLVLPARVNRWVNIVFGAIYRVIMILVIRGGWHCYVLYGLIEIT